MKIGIFGDSYAHEGSAYLLNLNNDKSWMKILTDCGYDITSYGMSGSSMYWSYKNYLQHRHKYDYIIFLATTINRIYVPTAKYNHWHSNYFLSEDDVRTQEAKKNNADHWEALKLYFSLLFNEEEHQTYKDLMLNEIEPNPNTLCLDVEKYLIPMSSKEFSQLKKIDSSICQFKDNRFCHFSQDGNTFIANKIVHWLKSGFFNYNDQDQYPDINETTISKIYNYFPK